MTTLNKVSEVVAKLSDKGFAEKYVVKVNKGSESNPRWLDVIEWYTACAMLDDVFGPFGWDAEIANSTSDYANGLYTVDMTLTGRALDDETGAVVELKRPGRGVGLVPRSALQSDSEHDRQAHGVKSDAITNATKPLGNGFGLYLYNQKNKKQPPTDSTQGKSDTRQPAAPASKGSGEGRPTERQLAALRKNGAPEEALEGLSFADASAMMTKVANNGWKWDASFGSSPTPAKKVPAKAPVVQADSVDNLDDLFAD